MSHLLVDYSSGLIDVKQFISPGFHGSFSLGRRVRACPLLDKGMSGADWVSAPPM